MLYASLTILLFATVSFSLSLTIDQLSLPFGFELTCVIIIRTRPRFVFRPAIGW